MKNRLVYADNLRSFVILLVVIMHSNVTYSGMGSWYYTEGNAASLDVASRVIFGLYGSFVQAWFMGFLFFLAGYFAAKSLQKKGTSSFIKERIFRLGLPLLIYVFIINPLMVFFYIKRDGLFFYEFMSFPEFYFGMIKGLYFISGTGPLWFAEALLIFCAVYAIIRKIFPNIVKSGGVPSFAKIMLLVFITSVAAFFIRLFYPIGSDFYNLQFGFFASYIVLFILGTNSAERNWFEKIVSDKNIIYLKLAVFAGIPVWGAIMIFGGALSGDIPMGGGFHWQTAAYALWESFTALTMTVGLIAFFGKKFSGENKLSRFISQNSFGIYMFHAPVLTGISLLCASIQFPMLAKHFMIFPAAYIASLAVSFALRRIPFIAKITA
ncbi:MAG TPA: acyltransferase family protein [Spirochaetota bacterium]|nr:acyltransferase family protein [Spirochaetota bacterium]HQO22348.1 acyltransferase family protein [Spirochaetota bacterium]HQQ23309.1 acyltransferase family protein [Spirochaetota bacterium]